MQISAESGRCGWDPLVHRRAYSRSNPSKKYNMFNHPFTLQLAATVALQVACVIIIFRIERQACYADDTDSLEFVFVHLLSCAGALLAFTRDVHDLVEDEIFPFLVHVATLYMTVALGYVVVSLLYLMDLIGCTYMRYSYCTVVAYGAAIVCIFFYFLDRCIHQVCVRRSTESNRVQHTTEANGANESGEPLCPNAPMLLTNV